VDLIPRAVQLFVLGFGNHCRVFPLFAGQLGKEDR
jgi:hypothetical protein